MKACVLVGGSFGTAMSVELSATCDDVVVWAREEDIVRAINERHENPVFLPGLSLPLNVSASLDMARALAGASLVVLAAPSQATRPVLLQAVGHLPLGAPIVTVAKGIETDTLLTMTEVMEACLPTSRHGDVAVLSGPSFAKEMVQKLPTVVTIASKNEETAKRCQAMLSSEHFRTYTSTDVVGVQIGGSVKNVIAIAAGMSDGLGLGHNARAGIITRGLAEMTRLAVKLGGQPITLAGLAGLGDLVLTCTAELSRNRHVGIELGKGKALADILQGMNQVAEGVKTAKSVRDLALKHSVDLPICNAVYAIAYDGKSAKQAAFELMGRTPKAEAV